MVRLSSPAASSTANAKSSDSGALMPKKGTLALRPKPGAIRKLPELIVMSSSTVPKSTNATPMIMLNVNLTDLR